MRKDIQFLRGIAVLSVVIYHSGLGLIPEGYLGVDIFFVISGFLITKLVLLSIESNSFSFSIFYYRRAKRLLPALYSTLLVTTLLAVIFQTNSQWNDYIEQFIGAITFTSNFVLPGQTGYFNASSEGKPLLHIWSLSLEEQYYFLLPILLFITPGRLRLATLITLLILSLLWCFEWISGLHQEAPFLWRFGDTSKYDWAFYLLPTRAWELLIGSVSAWVVIKKKSLLTPSLVNYVSLALLIFFLIVTVTPEHPSIEACIVTIATGTILLGKDDWLPDILPIKWICKIGDWSYSIYLVHWPLFSFAYLGYVGQVPLTISILISVTSILLGFIQYKYVENPFRRIRSDNRYSDMKYIVLATCVLTLIPLFFSSPILENKVNYDDLRQVNRGLSKECENSFSHDLTIKKECVSGNDIKTIVWGDSYAMHLVPGLIVSNEGVAQITKSVCGPFLNIAPIDQKRGASWAKLCIKYNNKALEFIKKTSSVTHVVLSSPISHYLNPRNRFQTPSGIVKANASMLIESYANTVSQIKSSGKEVIFISPPPKNGIDIGECLERFYGPAILFRKRCDILVKDYKSNQEKVIQLLENFKQYSKVLMLDELLCNTEVCDVEKNGIFIYRDSGHLSRNGSEHLLSDIIINKL